MRISALFFTVPIISDKVIQPHFKVLISFFLAGIISSNIPVPDRDRNCNWFSNWYGFYVTL